jgi:GxxExxY protein
MNTYTEFAAETTSDIIRCAIEVHRHLGPGLLESVYESALCLEFKSAGLRFARQVGVPYKGELIAEHRPDLVSTTR